MHGRERNVSACRCRGVGAFLNRSSRTRTSTMRNGEMVRRGSVRAGAWFSHGSKRWSLSTFVHPPKPPSVASVTSVRCCPISRVLAREQKPSAPVREHANNFRLSELVSVSLIPTHCDAVQFHRLRIPSFSRMLAQWTWTVFMLIPKASAISRVGLPRPR
jgi:hypothetical protein